MARLVLFDIDGTLVDIFGIHERAYSRVLRRLFGVDGSLFDVDFSGDTLPNVFASIARRKGLGETVIEAKRPLIPAAYAKALGKELKGADINLLPGIPELLERLSRNALLGVVSGNTSGASELILNGSGLRKYFRVHAFGEEGKERIDLLRLAFSRAGRLSKGLKPRDVYVVDDSSRGTEAAKKLGFAAIAVSTGPHSPESLKEAGADYLFPSLENVKSIVSIIR